MRKLMFASFSISTLALASVLLVPQCFAEEHDLGTHSQSEIATACNNAGGTLLGVSDSGSYGCEVESKGTMILCNKDQQCTGYTPAATHSQHVKIMNSLGLQDPPKAKKGSTQSKKSTTPTAAPKPSTN